MKAFKKILTVTMILVFCGTILAGCKKNEVQSPTETTKDASVDNKPDTSEKVTKQGTIQKSGNVILKELAFVYNGNTIAISDIVEDEKLENMLGKADEKKSHTYSKDDGLNMDPLIGMTEKQYKFPGLVIKTINGTEDKRFYIFNIKITDARYSTVRNIKVGDSLEKLKEAYPEGNMVGGGEGEKEDDFQYLPVNYVDGMKFHITNKKIDSILIYTLLD